MNESQFRKRWLRQHAQYEKIVYKELIKGFKELGNSIPFDLLTEDNYELFLEGFFKQDMFFRIYYNIYRDIGKIHGKRVGKTINTQLKEFTLNSFLAKFDKDLLGWLFNNVTERVVTVRKTYLDTLREIITFGVNDGKSMSQIATELKKKINQRGFYRWQALRIARTETTSASNYASIKAGESSGVAMDKVWISAVDNRTRKPPKSEFNHLIMNGVKVPDGEPFEVPFNGKVQKLMFAGDPKGSAGNVINCRCSTAVTPRRDKNGNLIFL